MQSGRGGTARGRGKRGPARTSCAECHRLKLKCDGKVPCNQCTKRGYTAICPDGTGTTGKGKRLFWDTTADLRIKLSQCIERITELEEALRSAHSVASHETHPLLTEERLNIKKVDSTYGSPEYSGGSEKDRGLDNSNDTEIQNRFGSLSITVDGESRFFGHAANSWYFLENEDEITNPADWNVQPPWPVELSNILVATEGFPITLLSPSYSHSIQDRLHILLEYLPPKDVANQTIITAFSLGFVPFKPIPQDQYMSHVHRHFYDVSPIDVMHPLTPARLAILFIVLAIGSIVQVASETSHYNPEAQRYYHLGQTALMISRLVEKPSIEGIQALFLSIIYSGMCDTALVDSSNVRWATIGLITKLAHMMGLQSDPDKFHLSSEEAKRRRLIFNEVYVYDLLQALVYSRPASIAPGYFDVQPYEDDRTNHETDYDVWKYKFCAECLGPVHSKAFAASPPSYTTALALARKVEDFPTFKALDPEQPGSTSSDERHLMKRRTSRVFKHDILLHLHRPFFTVATDKYREDPLGCEYGASVTAVYQAAREIISQCQYVITRFKDALKRSWPFMYKVIDGSMVLGILIIRCPQIPYAQEAYQHLCVACELLSTYVEWFSAYKVYEKMTKLRDLASLSLTTFAASGTRPSIPTSSHGSETAMALSLGAVTRTIARVAPEAVVPSLVSTPPDLDPTVAIPQPEVYHSSTFVSPLDVSPLGTNLSLATAARDMAPRNVYDHQQSLSASALQTSSHHRYGHAPHTESHLDYVNAQGMFMLHAPQDQFCNTEVQGSASVWQDNKSALSAAFSGMDDVMDFAFMHGFLSSPEDARLLGAQPGTDNTFDYSTDHFTANIPQHNLEHGLPLFNGRPREGMTQWARLMTEV